MFVCCGLESLGYFLIKEGLNDIKASNDYLLGKNDINLGDWAKANASNF